MMVSSRRLSLWGIVLFLLLLPAACAPAVATEPEAPAYPAGLLPTPSPLPYPRPTQPAPAPIEPAATEEPPPTEEPFPTEKPFPTLPPTPVVTPISTAAPPLIPLPEGATAEPFSLYWRDGDVILTLRSEGQAEPEVFLDPVKEFGLYLTPEEAYIRSWGTISPDGQTFALILTDEAAPNVAYGAPYPVHIYLFDVKSRAVRLLVKHGTQPIWSPDGKRIAYISAETGGVWVASVVDGDTREVYAVDRDHEHAIATNGFTWSPNNNYLAIVDQVINQSTTLIVTNLEGLEPDRILMEETLYLFGGPQWSPAGDSISLVWSFGEGGKGPHLWLIKPDGSERRQLTTNVRLLGELPQWSSDGEWIALGGSAQYERVSPTLDLWLVEPVGAEQKRITDGSVDLATRFGINALKPLWSPDGSQLVFIRVSENDELAEVWLMVLTDNRERKLVDIMTVFDDGLTVGP